MQASAPSILFVCSANVCRSPLALALFARIAPDLVQDGALRLLSAGVDAHPGSPRCEWSSAKAGDEADAGVGGARAVDETALQDATVVLAADRSVVSALIRRSPASRGRTFTVKEAAHLGQIALDGAHPRITSLEELTAEMDARRGWVPIERPDRRRLRRHHESWSTSFDVPDAHSGPVRVRHDVMFAELRPAIIRCADVVSAACSQE